jgi:Kef-type K+ transport system membrane component KefB
MRRIASLALAIAAVAWVHALGETGSVPSAGAALAVGFTLLGAWITGDLLRKFNLPRITGYLIFGVLVGPYLGNVITVPMTSQLQAVNGLATTLIALIAGLTISLERLRTTIASIARFTAATLVIVIIGMATLLWFAWPWLGIAAGSSNVERGVIVSLLTIMIASVSPTMTAAVTTETGSRGRLSARDWRRRERRQLRPGRPPLWRGSCCGIDLLPSSACLVIPFE